MQARMTWFGVVFVGCLIGWGPLASAGSAKDARGATKSSGSQDAGRVKIDPQVLQDLGRFAEQDPRLAMRLFQLAMEGYQKTHQQDRALAVAEAMVRDLPKEPGVTDRLLTLYQQLGKHDQALELARRLAQQHPENPLYQQAILNAQQAKGDTAGAMTTLENLVSAHPDNPTLQIQLAQLQAAHGKPQEAMQHAEAALKLNPQEARLVLQASQVYLSNQKGDQAKSVLEGLIKTSKDPWVLREAARQLAAIAKQQKAVDAFLAQAEAVLAQDPNNPAAQLELVEGCVVSDKPEQAIARLKTLLAQHPKEAIARMRLAQLQASNGQLEQGLTLLNEGLQAEPASLVFSEGIADLYVRANQPGEAVKRYEALLAKSTDTARKNFYQSRVEQLSKGR